MCSLWLDGLNGVAHHLKETTSFAVIAKAELPKLRAWARHRGWNRLRLLSSFGTSFNADLGAEHAQWGQQSRVSVFTMDQDGTIRLVYWGDPYFGEGQYRGIDLLSRSGTSSTCSRAAAATGCRPRATDGRPGQGWWRRLNSSRPAATDRGVLECASRSGYLTWAMATWRASPGVFGVETFSCGNKIRKPDD
jgi:predicted dithiol-disulfide oxidoreductase (DUF899 family)